MSSRSDLPTAARRWISSLVTAGFRGVSAIVVALSLGFVFLMVYGLISIGVVLVLVSPFMVWFEGDGGELSGAQIYGDQLSAVTIGIANTLAIGVAGSVRRARVWASWMSVLISISFVAIALVTVERADGADPVEGVAAAVAGGGSLAFGSLMLLLTTEPDAAEHQPHAP